jgi:hypothetical protein
MKSNYVRWKNKLAKDIRAKQRERSSKKKTLQGDEADEEEYEILETQRIFLQDDNTDEKYFDSLMTKKAEKPIPELAQIINVLHTEITMNVIRCELKAGKQLKKFLKEKSMAQATLNEQNKNLTLAQREGIEGVADSTIKKMSIMKEKTATTIRQNVNELQHTLQNAGKLDPPRPKIANYEKFLMDEANANPYMNALLYTMMAASKSKFPEQKYLLNQAFSESQAFLVFLLFFDNSPTHRVH